MLARIQKQSSQDLSLYPALLQYNTDKEKLVWMTGLFHSVYWCKMLLRCKSLWRERFGCCIYSLHFFDSASKEIILCTPTVASSPPYWPVAAAEIIHDPIGNKTPTLTFCFVFNKSAQQRWHIPVAFRKGIYHSAVDQIWHTTSCPGNSGGG